MYWCKQLAVVVFVSFYILFAVAIQQGLASEEKLLVFGRVQDNPVRATRDRQEFVDYVAKKLAPFGFTGGKVLVLEKVGQLAQAVKEGKVDFFHDSVAPTVVVSRSSGSIPILRQWKYNEPEYYSVILVKKNSGIDSLIGLKGKVIAFDEPHSTSAHILPRMLLLEKKLKLVQVVEPNRVEPDVVGYIHSSDDNSPNLLVTDKVDAAATSHREFENLRPEIRSGIKIIAQSMSVPRQIISVRKDLDPKIVLALKELLTGMEKTDEGRAVLKRQQGTTNIDTIPPESLESMKIVERFIFSTLGKQVNSW
jgi:ABC-type phosphate/phosphonate transport system substrate-binding protein